MIRNNIISVVKRINLSETEMINVMRAIMSGKATPDQIAAFITALRMKGETVDEITGAVKVIRERASMIDAGKNVLIIDRDDINMVRETILDVVGTGGDGTNTFNVSTTVAFVVSACGVKVAKHGNRAVSSLCGSADVIEALGINLDVTLEAVEQCVNEVGIGFLFAPSLLGDLNHTVGLQREIGIRTIFNILGPLINPTGVDCQFIGVYQLGLVEIFAEVLQNLGCRHGYVVHGRDGMDEITTTSETFVAEITSGGVKFSTISPEDFGLERCLMDDLRGGDATVNAEIIRNILSGEKGPKRDIVLLNAAYGLMAAKKATTVMEGMKLAADSIDSGKAFEQLRKLWLFRPLQTRSWQ